MHIPRIRIMPILMADVSAALTLQTWMSAAFPTGAFSCSHGMETLIADGRITDADNCESWIAGILEYGSGWNDAVLTMSAFSTMQALLPDSHATKLHENALPLETLQTSLHTVNELALALCAGSERRRESTQLGQSFARAAAATSRHSVLALIDHEICLPIAIGAQGALSNIPVDSLLPASLQASSSNLVWICTRLIPLGQTQALTIISNLQPLIIRTAQRARQSSLDDLGSCTLLADLASIEHEQLPSRICIT
ncbi:MAG: urease accessory protein UreF [Granulosicoccus sp.]